jgi:FtsH-binding integral membrane protein
MHSPEFEALLAQADRTQKLLWTVLTLSIVLYAVVAWVAAPAAPNPELADTLRPFFWVAAAALAATSLLLSRRRSAATTPGSTAPGPEEAPANALLRARGEDLPPRERRALSAVAGGFTTWIACLVMNEAIAILGLVLAFLAGGPGEVVPFALLAIVLNLAMRPDVRRRAEAALGGMGL